MNWLKENWFKLVAIVFLLVAIGSHPYAYYQATKWVVAASAAYSAYLAFNLNRKFWVWIFAILAILFNPLAPFYLNKETWRLFDVIAGIIFIVSVFYKNKSNVVQN